LRTEDEIPTGTIINGDALLLERFFDNLLSNLKKHSAIECPVLFRACMEDGYVRIAIENTICKERYSAGRSSLLGLKICARIIELHGGCFETSTTINAFHVSFSIPVLNLKQT
jgi:signal transduction histidine kinase